MSLTGICTASRELPARLPQVTCGSLAATWPTSAAPCQITAARNCTDIMENAKNAEIGPDKISSALLVLSLHDYLPARRYASAGNSDRNVSVRLSDCLSVTRQYCVKTKKASGMISSPSGRPWMTLNCCKVKFYRNFAWFLDFGRQPRLNEWR